MIKPKKNILRIGVTGGIGSGKSLVCAMFSELGFPVLSADEIARKLMRSDATLKRKLTALLGPETYYPDGSLNKMYVASCIFSDDALHRSVNRIVHPMVESALEKEFEKLRRKGKKFGIVEAALIYEAGYDSALDLTIVVDAPETRRLERIRRRDGSRPADVRKRIKAQWPVKEKLKRADYIIHNTGSKRELRQSVRFLSAMLHTIAENR